MQRCYGCMKELDRNHKECPYCGYIAGSDSENNSCLAPGTVLMGRYTVGRLLNCGGVEARYIAWDSDRRKTVMVKEFFSDTMMARNTSDNCVFCRESKNHTWMKTAAEKWLEEARIFSALIRSENTVHIYDCFEANNTAYVVTEYLQGRTFEEYINSKGGRLRPEKAVWLMLPVLNALERMHKNGVLHCDVSPDNILLCDDGNIKLIGFDSSNFANDNYGSNRALLIRQGYSPCELYSENGNQGPWTDVYSACATLYKAITGEKPVEASALTSCKAELKKFSEFGIVGYNRLEKIIFDGLESEINQRIPSISQLRAMLEAYSCAKTDPDDVGRRLISSQMAERKDYLNGKKHTIKTACICVAIVLLATVATALLVSSGNNDYETDVSSSQIINENTESDRTE